MNARVTKLIGSNMDIDLGVSDVKFGDKKCSWKIADGTNEHKCALKVFQFVSFFAEYNI